MPHDKNGKLLEVGNKVSIEAEITNITTNDDYCNVTLGIGKNEPHGAFNIQSTVTLNAKQVELIESE